MEGVSKDSISLIEMLLNPDLSQRLGHGGAEEVKNHPFFVGVEWGSLIENNPVFVPRYVPTLH